jgi:hypothetical protein
LNLHFVRKLWIFHDYLPFEEELAPLYEQTWIPFNYG